MMHQCQTRQTSTDYARTNSKMIKWGITGMSHDASIAVFSPDGLEFAAHAERYSRVKNDRVVDHRMLRDALEFGKPDQIYWYERPWLKKTRQLYAGQYKLLGKQTPWDHLMDRVGSATSPFVIPRIRYTTHHLSHAAAGYYTSPFEDATVVVLDSIGEWETFTIWEGSGFKLKKRYSQSYPHSVGIWYSAMTQRIGLKPQEHEYILMGMAAIGDPHRLYTAVVEDFVEKFPNKEDPSVRFKLNLHRGCRGWRPDLNSVQDLADIAAAVQLVYENILTGILHHTSSKYSSKNLVLMGGCALNCVANSLAPARYDDVWIMPNPGDAGSAIGCVLAHTKERFDMTHCYTGHNIEGEYPVEQILQRLDQDKITAVAWGRAEFGPRALGARSILADARGADVKDRVNAIKQREEFRPFAPMILEEHADEYFEMPVKRSPFMQFVAKCKKPEEFPAIVHYDGTSRVQTVGLETGPVRDMLEQWYKRTGSPMLLNTSLNVKGEPLVNSRADAVRWSEINGVDICLPVC